jgi:mRNA interferase MazF
VADVLRGEIYWASLNPVRGHKQGGVRPVLIISHDVFNQRSGTVIAMAITSQHQSAGFPLTYPVPTGVLPQPSWVKISQVRTLSTERLRNQVGQIGQHELDRIVDGLSQLVG